MSRLILLAALICCSTNSFSQALNGKIDVGSTLLNAEVLGELDENLNNTVTLQVTNSDSASYKCSGRIGFFSLSTGAEVTEAAVTGQATIPPGGPYVVVQAINPSASGLGNTLAYDSMTCSKVSGGITTTSLGGSISLAGAYSFSTNFAAKTVQINVATIVNSSASVTTGTLRVELWALSAPYSGGSVSGYKMAYSQIPPACGATGQLGPGVSCNDIKITASLTAPPAGSYYASLFVTQFSTSCTTSDKFCVVDYGNFPNAFVIAAGGATTGSSGGIQLLGGGSYSVNFNTNEVQLDVDSVSNASTKRTSGSLRLALWATSSVYSGGSISGYRMMAASLPASCFGPTAQLGPEQSCNNISINTSITNRPPAGNYYVTLIVDEYDSQNCTSSDKFCIATSRNFQNQLTVPAATTGGSVDTNTDDGGGGAIGIAFECALLLFLIAIRSRKVERRS